MSQERTNESYDMYVKTLTEKEKSGYQEAENEIMESYTTRYNDTYYNYYDYLEDSIEDCPSYKSGYNDGYYFKTKQMSYIEDISNEPTGEKTAPHSLTPKYTAVEISEMEK